MNYLIKYKTEVGTYYIGDDFSCWSNGGVFSRKALSLEGAKEICQDRYEKDLRLEMRKLSDRLEKLENEPEEISKLRVKL